MNILTSWCANYLNTASLSYYNWVLFLFLVMQWLYSVWSMLGWFSIGVCLLCSCLVLNFCSQKKKKRALANMIIPCYSYETIYLAAFDSNLGPIPLLLMLHNCDLWSFFFLIRKKYTWDRILVYGIHSLISFLYN